MSEDVKQLWNLYIDETTREVLELDKYNSNTCESAPQDMKTLNICVNF